MLEQWCFSIGKTDERLLTIGVSATGGKVAANGVAAEEGGKAKQVLDGVVSGVRMMAGWDVFVNGKKWKVPNRGVSASGKQPPVFFSGVSASEK
jgi:metal-dependent amidase/aminoacylase/carboxypeptidase family protein